MNSLRFSICALSLALAVGASGCATDREGSVSATLESKQADGSTVAVSTAPDNTKTEVRTFETGEIARVTRVTRPDGTRTATVEYRDGRKVELEDESAIEQAMEATGDAIAEAADATWEKSKEIGEEVGDKSEDVADKTADVSKKVAEETKDTAETVYDKSKKGAKKVGKGIKKVAGKVKDKID